ncbi:lachesin-like protein [Dinothrombium tinctorium]|uniref:Lachesin-like protein n=1 Tax=Dinothrombium tinctorium TaxID=1965070 RepID=A0A3S3PKE0_9ACAR|nr:lachesin-like protein [Dinothrombium tinctorium]
MFQTYNLIWKLLKLTICTVFVLAYLQINVLADENSEAPRFVRPMRNVTVPIGGKATFDCDIKNAKSVVVSWFRRDKNIVLAVAGYLIKRDPRYRIGRSSPESYFFQIKNVRESDVGQYECQLGTSPPQNTSAFLNIGGKNLSTTDFKLAFTKFGLSLFIQ